MESQIPEFINKFFDQEIINPLCEFVSMPGVSPMFDLEWKTNKNLDRICDFIINWFKKQNLTGAKIEKIQDENKTPLLFIEVPATDPQCEKTLLMYAHMDTYPLCEKDGWDEGLGPLKPVIKDGKLYGRGSVDDGYAFFSMGAAIKCIQSFNGKHPRIVILVESDEEGYRKDIGYYLDAYREKIGKVDVIICLDSDSNDTQRLWLTTSIRGIIKCTMKIKLLNRPLHSGIVGGIVPDINLVARKLLNRIENIDTGKLADFLYDPVSEKNQKFLREAASITMAGMYQEIKQSAVPTMRPVYENDDENKDYQLLYNNLWGPSLAVIGMDGLPNLKVAENFIRPELDVMMCIRLPPTLNAIEAYDKLERLLTTDTPFGAEVTLKKHRAETGWTLNNLDDNLFEVLDSSSKQFFGKGVAYTGGGGSLPIVFDLVDRYPNAQILLTGLIRQDSNIHAPNENIDLDLCRKLICALTKVISAVSQQ